MRRRMRSTSEVPTFTGDDYLIILAADTEPSFAGMRRSVARWKAAILGGLGGKDRKGISRSRSSIIS